jgi:hypothetical protein
MKVVFINIDGVLNNTTYLEKFYSLPESEQNNIPLCSKNISHLKDILVKLPNIKLVFLSFWCLVGETLVYSNIINAGIPKDRIGGAVRALQEKDKEIQNWLSKREIEDYIIIDDDMQELESLKDKCVIPLMENGLSENDVLEVINKMSCQ